MCCMYVCIMIAQIYERIDNKKGFPFVADWCLLYIKDRQIQGIIYQEAILKLAGNFALIQALIHARVA